MSKEVSPAGSFKGYSLAEYLRRNIDFFKIFGTASLTIATAGYSAFGVGLAPELITPVSAGVGAIFHLVVSAIEFRQKRVEL